ncbi:MAG TPA: Flp family type IVb pilin [Stellaceae bacterium]|nr:Flp family type IVb pilin [Stellaceae bacterium]
MVRNICKILAVRDGTTAIEYGMIGCLVSIAIIAGITAIGTTISANFFGPVIGAL